MGGVQPGASGAAPGIHAGERATQTGRAREGDGQPGKGAGA